MQYQSAMAAAFTKAAIKCGDLDKKVDHKCWIARRIADNVVNRHVGDVKVVIKGNFK